MVDVVRTEIRSRMMAGIKAGNTKPEIRLRKALHSAGLRYRLHVAGLSGKPDIVLPSRRATIFVHGCFWHRHAGCHWCTTPADNAEFWANKFVRNIERDREVIEMLANSGWRTGIVWECGLRASYISATIEAVRDWIASDRSNFESGVVRPKG
ncbi:very short patch repair endonuclease [Mesorhizobium sp. M1136]|uniref:very short patch repair endonuclease n=1 Tax=unclassified Mesorhizobium TaxID=325217 RepID=UPI00333633BA